MYVYTYLLVATALAFIDFHFLQAVKGFFRKNMEVCLSWLANIRGYLVSVAIHAGLPGVALRHGFAALENLKESRAAHVRNLYACMYY